MSAEKSLLPKKRSRTPSRTRQGLKNVGRCTPDFIDAAISLCSKFATDRAICRALNVLPTLWCEWKDRAYAGQEPWKSMFEKIEQARCLKSFELASSIAQDPDWRAKAWLLERLDPAFNLRHRHEHSGTDRTHLPSLASVPVVNIIIEREIVDSPWIPQD